MSLSLACECLTHVRRQDAFHIPIFGHGSPRDLVALLSQLFCQLCVAQWLLLVAHDFLQRGADMQAPIEELRKGHDLP